MFNFDSTGSFDNTEAWLTKMSKGDIFGQLDRYGQAGVKALSIATPRDTGIAANSWYYEVRNEKGGWSIIWSNADLTSARIPVVILLQYGHGTRNGGYVQGRDFINPAIRPVMDQIADDVWKVVMGK